MSAHRICTDCEIHHAENCQSCFGFGLWARPNMRETGPITAYEAHEGQRLEDYTASVCPECGGGTLNRGAAKAVAP
jgi:hypothetical protein